MVKRYKEEGKSGLLHKSINKPSNNAIGQDIKQKCKVLWNWIKKYGIPLSIYCDKRNMYILEKDYEELNNEKGYFRQMCHGLNIKVITANSPQAKGKVERSNQTHQDRLIKKMRLLNIRSVDEANKYLKNHYIRQHNQKFAVQIINITIDIHRKLDKNVKSNYVCYAEEIRKINNDWTMSFKGKIYQLNKQSQFNLPTKSTVYVKKSIHGVVSIFYRNLPIEYTVVKWKSTRHFKFGGIMIF